MIIFHALGLVSSHKCLSHNFIAMVRPAAVCPDQSVMLFKVNKFENARFA